MRPASCAVVYYNTHLYAKCSQWLPSVTGLYGTMITAFLYDELLLIVLQYLDPLSLLTIELISCELRSFVRRNDRFLYSTSFSATIRRKAHFHSNPSLLERIKSLHLRTLKKYLRASDTSRCVEKSEYQRLLMARALLVYSSRTETNPAMMVKTCVTHPPWSLSIAEWKVFSQCCTLSILLK